MLSASPASVSVDASVHGTAFFSAATNSTTLVVPQEEDENERHLPLTRQRQDSGDVPCAFRRVGLGLPPLTATAVTSGSAAVAIRCHTFFDEPRRTDVRAAGHFRHWRVEVHKLVRVSCAPN